LKGAFKIEGDDYGCNSGAFNTIEISLIAPLNDLFYTLDAVKNNQNHHKVFGLSYYIFYRIPKHRGNDFSHFQPSF